MSGLRSQDLRLDSLRLVGAFPSVARDGRKNTMNFTCSAALDSDFSKFDFAGNAGAGDAASQRSSGSAC